MSTITSIHRLKDKVEDILCRFPQTRNSDIELTIKIWQIYHGVEEFINIHRLFDLPREDSVKRMRAKIQNEEHKYLPMNWKIAKKRGIAKHIWEDALGYRPALFRVSEENKKKEEGQTEMILA